jgi:hypothetical protein
VHYVRLGHEGYIVVCKGWEYYGLGREDREPSGEGQMGQAKAHPKWPPVFQNNKGRGGWEKKEWY